MDGSKIEWTDATWNVLRGCSRVSEGCRFCYAERVAARFNNVGEPYEGLARREYHQGAYEPRWTGEVKFIADKLEDPCRWSRPRRIFVNSMSDLFHEKVPDEWIDRIFRVMRSEERHTFQVLTKRPERMRAYMEERVKNAHGISGPWPPKNVWLGVSIEDQKTADERIQLLLQTPAAVWWISAEPLLGLIDLYRYIDPCGYYCDASVGHVDHQVKRGLDWVVVGGESGPHARPFNLASAWLIVNQCKRAEVPVFVKQLGSQPFRNIPEDDGCGSINIRTELVHLKDKKGGDMAEWPHDLRIREFPKEVVHA